MAHVTMTAVRVRRWSVDDYHAMVASGVIGPDERVELIDGEVIETSAMSARHNATADRLNRHFVIAAGERALVRVQGSFLLSQYSEPEPDLALLE